VVKYLPPALGFISLLYLLQSCGESDNKPGRGVESASLRSSLEEHCGKHLYPAIYHLPQTSHLFDNGDEQIWMGQPVDALYSMLSNSEREGLKNDLNRFYRDLESEEQRLRLEQLFLQWCTAYQVYRIHSEEISQEELLAEWYISQEYRHLFADFENRPFFQFDETEPIDKTASLSSAESNRLVADWITSIALYSTADFEDWLSRNEI